MGQVFSVTVHRPSNGLAFQGFYKRGPRKPRFRIPTSIVDACTNQEPKRSMLITRKQWPGSLTKFRSRKSEAASPIGAAPNATLRSLHLAGLRGGLARNRAMRCITLAGADLTVNAKVSIFDSPDSAPVPDVSAITLYRVAVRTHRPVF